jgi:hypothetical protein
MMMKRATPAACFINQTKKNLKPPKNAKIEFMELILTKYKQTIALLTFGFIKV